MAKFCHWCLVPGSDVQAYTITPFLNQALPLLTIKGKRNDVGRIFFDGKCHKDRTVLININAALIQTSLTGCSSDPPCLPSGVISKLLLLLPDAQSTSMSGAGVAQECGHDLITWCSSNIPRVTCGEEWISWLRDLWWLHKSMRGVQKTERSFMNWY